MTASINAEGAITFTNLGAATNTIALSSVNSVLNKALSTADGVIGDKTTDQFSHVAVATDELTTLRDYQGNDLDLQLTDTISVNGRVGGESISTLSIDVDDGEGNSLTYGEYIKLIKDAFGITNSTGIEINSSNGAMIINADGGKANEITAINITTSGDAEVFDSVFDATIGNWSETQEAEDVTHSASVEVYDSLGNTHTITVEFKKDSTLPNQWTWSVSLPEPAELSGGASGTISFDSNGNVESFSYADGASALTFDPKNGADVPVEIVLDFGTIGSSDGLTQYASTSTAIARDQNGYSAGTLETVSIGDDGTITGSFTNGNSRTLARLVLATFNNSAGLLRVGDNTYTVSSNSGLPIYGFAGTSINCTLTPGALEMSNVDIAEEFTNMIIAQRTYQANSRTITTMDEILTETVNLKR